MAVLVEAGVAVDSGRFSPHALAMGQEVLVATVYYEYVPSDVEVLDTDVPLATRERPVSEDSNPSMAREVHRRDDTVTGEVTHIGEHYVHVQPPDIEEGRRTATMVVPRNVTALSRLVVPSPFRKATAQQYVDYQLWHPGSKLAADDERLEPAKA